MTISQMFETKAPQAEGQLMINHLYKNMLLSPYRFFTLQYCVLNYKFVVKAMETDDMYTESEQEETEQEENVSL